MPNTKKTDEPNAGPVLLEGSVLNKLAELSRRLGWNQHLIVAKAIDLLWTVEENGADPEQIRQQLESPGSMTEKVRKLENEVARLRALVDERGHNPDPDEKA